MTISPGVAKRIFRLVRAYRAWDKGVVEGDDWLTACALDDLKRVMDDFRTACPHCGAAMIATQDHKVFTDKISSYRYCPSCSTTVSILTPAHG